MKQLKMFNFKYYGRFVYPDGLKRDEWGIFLKTKIVGLISSLDMVNAELRSFEPIVISNEEQLIEDFYSYMENGSNSSDKLDS